MPDRVTTSRRAVCRLLSSAGVAFIPSAGVASADAKSTSTALESRPNATQYVAVVDRIVDGEHVVLLLERDGNIVDQLVVDVAEFDDVNERDILIVVVRDDELVATRHVDARPENGPGTL